KVLLLPFPSRLKGTCDSEEFIILPERLQRVNDGLASIRCERKLVDPFQFMSNTSDLVYSESRCTELLSNWLKKYGAPHTSRGSDKIEFARSSDQFVNSLVYGELSHSLVSVQQSEQERLMERTISRFQQISDLTPVKGEQVERQVVIVSDIPVREDASLLRK